MKKIISRQSSICAHARRLGKDRSYRTQCGEFICDGRKLLGEAIKSEIDIISIFTSSQLEAALPEDINIYKVPQDIIDSLSPLKNPQDTLFICKIPGQAEIDCKHGTHILLDNVQDPGNIGTIIRSADAFGIGSVILYGDCADPYNPKAIRASMGAIFRHRPVFIHNFEDLREISARFIGTANSSRHTAVNEANLKDSVIVLGNEGEGISEELIPLCEKMVAIPVSPECESLNVAIAASIIMWEARKYRDKGLGIRN